MPLTVTFKDGAVVLDGTIDDPEMVATILRVQKEQGLATWEEAVHLCLVTGARHMRFSDNPVPEAQQRRTRSWKLP